ncbi:MAG: AIPR family protein [Bryobacteraceae bacterium]
MSNHDLRALDANFDAWKSERAAELPEDKAFEVYVINQTLKDYDLSDEDIDFGNLGGGDDGGVDGMYLFINGLLIRDETTPPVPASRVELVLIQATREKSFKEERVEKFHQFSRDIFDYTRVPDEIKYLNSSARDAITRFREKHAATLKYDPKLIITFHYACKSITEPGPKDKTTQRGSTLQNFVKTHFSDALFGFNFWTSQKLLAAARKTSKSEVVVAINKHFATDDGSTVFLVKIKDYAFDVLADDNGDLNTRILAPNVRDYNGTANKVNTEIRTTLMDKKSQEDFWWLNNGVTILASSCSINGNKATIRNPEVVNGLQTSHEIFGTRATFSPTDSRQLLVRVVIPIDERSRDKIIKATNSQTPVKPLSLLANERIQFDIEDRLKRYGLFYDRRHGEYKRLKKPLASIVGPTELIQAVMSIALAVPDEARGRPLTYFDQHSDSIFHSGYNRDLYAACVLIDRQVNKFLRSTDLPSDSRRDVRFYVSLGVCCSLAGKVDPSVDEIAALAKACVAPIDPLILASALEDALSTYQESGGNDKVAKSSKMRDVMLAKIKKRISVGGVVMASA